MIIENMRNKPTNLNTYPIKIIKNARRILSPILAHLINNSLSKGCFPNSLKRARVVPLHKGGDRDDINNYRPISILPLFSKIFERIMYNQLYNFLEKYEILNPDQFGFRKNRSTIEAVLNQLEYIYTNLDQKKTVISIFLDFKKAFDCIDHKILLRKLFFYALYAQYFKSMHLMKLDDMYKQQVLCYMFKSCLACDKNSNIHDYPTRIRNNLVIPRFHRAKTQATIFYRGVILWNDLDLEMRSKRDVKCFKNSLKKKLILQY